MARKFAKGLVCRFLGHEWDQECPVAPPVTVRICLRCEIAGFWDTEGRRLSIEDKP